MSDEHASIWSALMQVAFRQDYVDAGGVRTRFAESGNAGAPAVVMLHGTGAHWERSPATSGHAATTSARSPST